MNFFIKQGATHPILKLRLIDDGKNDKSSFNNQLRNAEIKFDMFDVKTGNYQVLQGVCNIVLRAKKENFRTNEFYIVYRFKEEDTSIIGKFEGVITINFKNASNESIGKLIVPIREKLFIHII